MRDDPKRKVIMFENDSEYKSDYLPGWIRRLKESDQIKCKT